jgi:hypothetical protein
MLRGDLHRGVARHIGTSLETKMSAGRLVRQHRTAPLTHSPADDERATQMVTPGDTPCPNPVDRAKLALSILNQRLPVLDLVGADNEPAFVEQMLEHARMALAGYTVEQIALATPDTWAA